MIASAALIGFGEAGAIFARDLRARGVAELCAYDPLFADPASPAARNLARADGVRACADAREAARGAELVFVAVTAGSDLEAAAALHGALDHAPFVADVNSVSPGVKRQAAEIVAAAGGRYVEAAVMASVPPKGLATPMLLGGPYAAAFAPVAAGLGMDVEVFSDAVGRASSVKMCRSVVIKGLEAILLESLLAARRYGVEAEVLASLGDTIPGADWPQLARYMIGRAALHGRRRAEEMHEAARTVDEAGLEPLSASATAARQGWAAEIAARTPADALSAPDLAILLDGLLAALPPKIASQGAAA
jgi:3-hydroxyisobutyrate dehydrogenase-like beta-hydroxyacid dehydrogenase